MNNLPNVATVQKSTWRDTTSTSQYSRHCGSWLLYTTADIYRHVELDTDTLSDNNLQASDFFDMQNKIVNKVVTYTIQLSHLNNFDNTHQQLPKHNTESYLASTTATCGEIQNEWKRKKRKMQNLPTVQILL